MKHSESVKSTKAQTSQVVHSSQKAQSAKKSEATHANPCIQQFMQGNRFNFSMSAFAVLLNAACSIILAFVLRTIVEGMELHNYHKLISCLLLVISFILLMVISGLLKKTYKNRYMKKSLSQFKKYIFEKLLAKSIGEFDQTSSGKFISAFSNDLNSIETNYLSGNLTIILQILLLIGGLGSMICIQPTLGFCVLGVSIIPAFISLKYGGRLVQNEKNTSDQNESFVDQVKDLLNGFVVIKSFKAEKEVLHLFDHRNFELEAVKNSRRETSDTVEIISTVGFTAVYLVIFGLGSFFAFTGVMTIGAVLAFVQLSNYVLNPIQTLVPLWSNRKAAIGLIEKLEQAIANDSDSSTSTASKNSLANFEKNITFENVSYSYDDEKEVLDNINLTFEKGKSYAIVGGSGCGKSTLLRLLLGHFDQYEGNIRFDDRELRSICLDSLYDTVSVIQQNVFLFDSSIKNNITMFKEFSTDTYERSIAMSGLSELIQGKGDTYACGEGGRSLSGGEKQRVSIARCMIRQTPVLLMDEATAALDNATSYTVTKSILEIEQLTKIIVTHKLDETLMRKYDNIIVLNNGKVVEIGNFEKLMFTKGFFYSLFNVMK